MKHRIVIVVGLLAALMLVRYVPAQEAEPTERRPDLIERLNFEGGNVVEYVALIRRLVPEANIVLMPGAEQFQMPPMELRNVTVPHAMQLIMSTASSPAGGRIEVFNVGNIFASRVYQGQRTAPQAPQTEPMVLSLADVVDEELRAEDVLTSIEIAMELFDDTYPEARIRYHDATRLLIARGHPEQMIQISNVVDQLRRSRSVRATRADFQSLRMQVSQYRDEARDWEQQVRALQEIIAELERELASR